VIPKTTTYRQFKEKKAREDADAAAAAAAAAPLAPGQTTLQNGYINFQPEESSREESNRPSSPPNFGFPVNGSPMANRTLNTSGHGHPSHLMQADVGMEDEAMS